MTRHWAGRIALLGLLIALLYVGLSTFDYEPHVARLALLTGVCVAVMWLAIDVFVDPGPGWPVSQEPAVPEPPLDPRLRSHLRVLESHLSTRAPDAGVRNILAEIADRRLEQRFGLRLEDLEGRERLGSEATAVIEGATRRLSVEGIDRFLRHIEGL